MAGIGKFLIICGIIFIITGSLFVLFPKIPLFRLPGDIFIKRENFSFYMPIVTSILISLILTLILNLILRR
jgi:hypothetical protein